MSCERLHAVLDDFLARRLGAREQRALDDHLLECEECRTVVSMLRDDAANTDRAFVKDVLARTSGRTCARVCEEMAMVESDGVDDVVLPGFVLDHLGDCTDCAAVGAELALARRHLPSFAAAWVDADFTADVLMATLERPHLASVFAMRVRERIGRWFERPQSAQEFAYAVAVLLVLLTSTPWSPWPELPARALAFVQFTEQAHADEAPVAPIVEPENWNVVQALPPLRAMSAATVELESQFGESVAPRLDRVARDLSWVGAGLGEAGRGMLEGDQSVVREGVNVVGCGLSSLWIGLRVPKAPIDEDCVDHEPEGGSETGREETP